jgi:hypothetical protein
MYEDRRASLRERILFTAQEPRVTMLVRGFLLSEAAMKRALFGMLFLSVGATGVALQACGGDDSAIGTGDASTDTSMNGDVTSGDAIATDGDDGGGGDSGPTCAPPTDSTKSALCIVIAPEAITFLANANLDGKGFLAVDVHDVANPDAPDGAPIPALQAVTFPSLDAGPDAALFDLSTPAPTIRFDGLPATVYPRVVFVDSVGTQKATAGWWLGGYDLSNGIGDTVLLKQVTLTPGKGTTVTIDLTALRLLRVTLTRSATPIGNAQGPANFAVISDQIPGSGTKAFGLGNSACGKVDGTNTAEVNGFVIGKGPYYVFAQVDDFGIGGFLPSGALASLEIVDGGLQNPASSQITYAANAYSITKTIDLDITVPRPDAGTDNVVCP